jgi:hypothetical protein
MLSLMKGKRRVYEYRPFDAEENRERVLMHIRAGVRPLTAAENEGLTRPFRRAYARGKLVEDVLIEHWLEGEALELSARQQADYDLYMAVNQALAECRVPVEVAYYREAKRDPYKARRWLERDDQQHDDSRASEPARNYTLNVFVGPAPNKIGDGEA